MHDILGREIPEKAVVVVKASKSTNKKMETGVWLDGYVVSLKNGKPYRRKLSEVFLVERPTKVDRQMRSDVLRTIRELKNKKHKKTFRILKEGYVYEDEHHNQLLYVGKREVEIEIQTANGWKILEAKEGRFAVKLNRNQKKVTPDILFYTNIKPPHSSLRCVDSLPLKEIGIKTSAFPEVIVQTTPHEYGGMNDYTTRITLTRLESKDDTEADMTTDNLEYSQL